MSWHDSSLALGSIRLALAVSSNNHALFEFEVASTVHENFWRQLIIKLINESANPDF